MFRHVVMFRLSSEATQATRDEILRGLAALPRSIPEIQGFSFGLDAGIAEGNFDVAVVAEFADKAAYLIYAIHPAHVEFVTTKVRPHLSERVAVQFGPA